jgi:hypothetical protein
MVESRSSVLGTTIGYGLDDRWGRNSSASKVKNSYLLHVGPALGPTKPPIQWVPEALSSGVKRPGHEADHSPPNSTEVKKTWVYTSTPTHAFMAVLN